MADSVDALERHIRTEFPGWLEGAGLEEELIGAWRSGEDPDGGAMVFNYLGPLVATRVKAGVLKAVANGKDALPDLADAAALATLQLPFVIALLPRGGNTFVAPDEAMLGFLHAATMGWGDRAEFLARLILRELGRADERRGDVQGAALGYGATLFSWPYVVADILADWLGQPAPDNDWRRTHWEGSIGGAKGWRELAENWREPDPFRFEHILNGAADYYVAECSFMKTLRSDRKRGGAEQHFEVERDEYWLYPILLYAMLRLREWEGLPNPAHLNHELFRKSALKALPPAVAWPADPFREGLEARYREEFPDTPTPDDLTPMRH